MFCCNYERHGIASGTPSRTRGIPTDEHLASDCFTVPVVWDNKNGRTTVEQQPCHGNVVRKTVRLRPPNYSQIREKSHLERFCAASFPTDCVEFAGDVHFRAKCSEVLTHSLRRGLRLSLEPVAVGHDFFDPFVTTHLVHGGRPADPGKGQIYLDEGRTPASCEHGRVLRAPFCRTDWDQENP